MENNYPFVSVIIPCRNDKKYIEILLDSILESDYPKGKLEVLAVDGKSDDGTKEILENYSKNRGFIKVMDNEKLYTPFAINTGIKASKGDIISIIGAHSRVEKDFISKSVKYLNEYPEADCVGGLRKVINLDKKAMSSAISIASSSYFGGGDAKFELNPKKVQYVDTAYRPFYRKEVFNKIGLFNENLLRTQDMEFNIRLKKAGGKILLAPDIVSYYFQKHSFPGFFVHNFIDGVWATYPAKFSNNHLSIRHYMPLIFVSFVVLSAFGSFFSSWIFIVFLAVALTYIVVNLIFSFLLAVKNGLKYFFILPFVFANRHFGYGLGSIWGLIKIIL